MKITEVLTKSCIIIPPIGKTKDEIIKEIANLIFLEHPEVNREESIKSIFERESVETTAIGDGFAIPHAVIASCKKIYLGFGLIPDGIDFDSIDGKPVKIVLLILFPKGNIGLQLRFLAKLSRFAHQKDLVARLFDCKTAEEVLDTFDTYEKEHN